VIPRLSGTNFERNFAIPRTRKPFNSRDGNMQYDSGPTRVGHNQVAASSQHEQWQVGGSREPDCLLHGFRRVGFYKEPGRASDPKCGQRREGNIFLNEHG